VLIRLALRVVAPGVYVLVPQPPFSIADAADQVLVPGATPAGGCGTGAGKGQLLAAVALDDGALWVPRKAVPFCKSHQPSAFSYQQEQKS
jgi:hypothetical protein